MSPGEFRNLVATRSDAELLERCLREDLIPYVFEPKPEAWTAFRAELCAELNMAEGDIAIVGSARLGISLKPHNNLKAFSDKSDIDVVVVNADLFDQLWYALLRAAYPRPPVTDKVGGWLASRQKELYTGWLSPLEIRLDKRIFGLRAVPVLEFNMRWFNTFKKASKYPPRRHEDITGRLYRTWQHAELYHLQSLAALRSSLVA
jgi:hypothetical protein